MKNKPNGSDQPEAGRILADIGTTPERWRQFGDTIAATGISRRYMMAKLIEYYLESEDPVRQRVEAMRIPVIESPSEQVDTKGPSSFGKRPRRDSRTRTNSFPSWMSGVRVPSPALHGKDYSGTIPESVPGSVPGMALA